MNTRTRLDILDKTLVNAGIAKRDYSLKGYSEDRVCLNYEKGAWHVYVAERGQKCGLYSNRNFKMAVKNLIEKVASTPDQAENMMDYYLTQCKAGAIQEKFIGPIQYDKNNVAYGVRVRTKFIAGKPAYSVKTLVTRRKKNRGNEEGLER